MTKDALTIQWRLGNLKMTVRPNECSRERAGEDQGVWFHAYERSTIAHSWQANSVGLIFRWVSSGAS